MERGRVSEPSQGLSWSGNYSWALCFFSFVYIFITSLHSVMNKVVILIFFAERVCYEYQPYRDS